MQNLEKERIPTCHRFDILQQLLDSKVWYVWRPFCMLSDWLSQTVSDDTGFIFKQKILSNQSSAPNLQRSYQSMNVKVIVKNLNWPVYTF